MNTLENIINTFQYLPNNLKNRTKGNTLDTVNIEATRPRNLSNLLLLIFLSKK